MIDDTPTPLKPQDTVIYLLGELKGQVGGLKDSVDTSNLSQATINAANETEHAKFRSEIANHDTLIAGFTQDRADRSRVKLTGLQLAGVWASWVACAAAFLTLGYFIIANHP